MSETEQNLWYTDVDNEIVDNNSKDEKELIDSINSAIDSAKELSNLECDKLADNFDKKLFWLMTKNLFTMFIYLKIFKFFYEICIAAII